MAREWITAEATLRYLSDQPLTYNEQRVICERAHAGVIAARAEKLIWNGEERQLQLIPKKFWWAEGEEALEQNWQTGDFSTWIDHKVPARAYGVCFDFLAIVDLLPAEKRAAAMQRFSTSDSPDWIHARELFRLASKRMSFSNVGRAIIEACSLGQLPARAMRALRTGAIRTQRADMTVEWAEIEWDVPIWFWREFTQPERSVQDWQLGKARGTGVWNGERAKIELQGLLHRAGLRALGIDDGPALGAERSSLRGRRPAYDRSAASAAVWGQIYRGELKPETQADIERALQAQLTVGDREPSESTVRPYAKLIWDESQKA